MREELSFAISQPIAHPEQFEALGLPAATGVLLFGPPGCGKTLVAKAVANDSGANFISIKVGRAGVGHRCSACLPACHPAILPACLPPCPPACLPAYLPSCLPALLSASVPSCLPAE